jgi:hypothetical protein
VPSWRKRGRRFAAWVRYPPPERIAASSAIDPEEASLVQLPARSRSVLSCAAAALAAAALSAAPAAAHTATPGPGCPAVPTVQPFSAWQDVADYVLAPDGDIEAGARSWQLEGGARAGEGNEPFRVGGAADHTALDLPAGAAATTAPMCIGVEHRTMRFFATGATSGELTVQALYRERDGRRKAVTLGSIRGRGAWAPSDILPMRVNEKAPEFGNALAVSLRFAPRGSSSWRIDDVYVDPYRSR